MFFIYQYHDPRTWDLVYIGLTDNLERRMKQHFYRADSPVYPLAKELRGLGLRLHASVLDQHADLKVARELERKHIQEKKPILNTTHNKMFDVESILAVNKRKTERYSFEVYTDQKEDIQLLCDMYEQTTGKKLSASRLIREVLDTFLPEAIKTYEPGGKLVND